MFELHAWSLVIGALVGALVTAIVVLAYVVNNNKSEEE